MSRSRHPLSRRIRYWRSRPAWVVALFLLLAAIRLWQDYSTPRQPEALPEGIYRVERVVDGDTLLLANQARIRLWGTDTPETVHPRKPVEPFGPEATDFTKQFVADGGGSVRLQMDRERLDKYDRFLAYVWVDDRMLNEELIRAGLATAETGYNYSQSIKTRFRRAEDEAKSNRRGIWSMPQSDSTESGGR
jgi:micrococcal nuclease